MGQEGKKNKGHKHKHQHQPVNEQNLLLATLLNLVITIVEVAGGIISNSLALLSDALHNLSDTFATFIAYAAIRVSKKKANSQKTFGYKRVEILAAMLNAVILVIICLYLFKEAWERVQNPEPVKSLIMIIVAMIGLGANILAVAILKKDAKKSINVRAAYIHLIGDSLSSVLVIIAALAMQLFEVYWLDPIITILIGIFLIREAFLILKEAVDILMQSTPENIDVKKLKRKVERIEEINNIHHLHVWSLSDHQIHLEAHVELKENLKLSELNHIQEKIEELLQTNFNINHITLQFEYNSKHNKNLISS